MRFGIGIWSLALVGTLVVGSIAQQPIAQPLSGPQFEAQQYESQFPPPQPASGQRFGFPPPQSPPQVASVPQTASVPQAASGRSPVSSAPSAVGTAGMPHTDTPYRVEEVFSGEKIGLGEPDSGVQVGSAGQLIGFSGFDGSGSQTITLVHTGKMQIAVYHIDRSGLIHFVSSRPIDADFSVTLNPTDPSPDQIRHLGGQVK